MMMGMDPNFLDETMMEMVTVQNETKRPNITVNGSSTANGYYPYSGAANDDPLTPNIDERQGIPATSQLQKH
jgi:hypothetical protein